MKRWALRAMATATFCAPCAGMDLPGVDTIWRQLFPGQRNHHFPRYAGSVARQEGRQLVLTESFCVYGNGLTLAEMKWLMDYQYVRGCNITGDGQLPGRNLGKPDERRAAALSGR